MKGRRLPDTVLGELPDDIQSGDYWRYVNRVSNEPMRAGEPSNLTGGIWGFSAPNGCGIGTLTKHTVREHEDGTASIRRNDGSSNSVKIVSGELEFHGYLEHGVWSSV